ncbi:MAG: hypothetical protein KJO07_15550 [Deltaproteobacteria bacterium]|nr:hypothetical protein [Deltaproteobacteria bacterium]
MRWALALAFCLVGCSGDSEPSCQYSTADSGGLCQIDFFCEDGVDRAVYCATNASGAYECACGPAVDDPLEFVSDDFCDLAAEDRYARAVEACGFGI